MPSKQGRKIRLLPTYGRLRSRLAGGSAPDCRAQHSRSRTGPTQLSKNSCSGHARERSRFSTCGRKMSFPSGTCPVPLEIFDLPNAFGLRRPPKFGNDDLAPRHCLHQLIKLNPIRVARNKPSKRLPRALARMRLPRCKRVNDVNYFRFWEYNCLHECNNLARRRRCDNFLQDAIHPDVPNTNRSRHRL